MTPEPYPEPVDTLAARVRLGTGLAQRMDIEPRISEGALLEELRQKGLPLDLKRLRSIIDCIFNTLSRLEIEVLMDWCHSRHGPDGHGGHFFVSRLQPDVWSTFVPDSGINLFVGRKPTGGRLQEDINVQVSLVGFLANRACYPNAPRVGVSDTEEVRKAMETSNCLFIGSPRFNPATEIALSLLADTLPFRGSNANSQLTPVCFTNPTWGDIGERYSTVISQPKGEVGLLVKLDDAASPKFLQIPWRPAKEYNKQEIHSFDAGLFVAVRQPLVTSVPVTTIILAGMTAVATRIMARDLIDGRVDLDDAALAPGVPTVRIAMTPYRKPAGQQFPESKPLRGRQWLSLERALDRWSDFLRLRDRATPGGHRRHSRSARES